MNGLTLRVSGGSKTRAPSAALPPVTLSPHHTSYFRNIGNKYLVFVSSSTAEQQLMTLKDILNGNNITEDAGKFAAVVFLTAEPKHPIKCYLARHITKTKNLQFIFERHLTEELVNRISSETNDMATLTDTIEAVVSCSENFASGSAALKRCEVALFGYLERALKHNLEILQTDKTSLSSTQKNESITLMHNTVRALLNVVQKLDDDNAETIVNALTYGSLEVSMQRLFYAEDVPMDTKQLSAILRVTVHSLKHGGDYWIQTLACLTTMNAINTESAINRICDYSAIVTVVSIQQLETRAAPNNECALIIIVSHILNISEKFSVEPLVALCVARTLLNVTKALQKSAGTAAGISASVSILSFVWAHLEHFMDSVRHLTGQVLANVLKYFGKHQDKGFSVFSVFFSELKSLPPNKKAYYIGLSASASVLGTEAILARIPNLIDSLIDMLANQAVQANVATTMETLLHKHTQEVKTDRVYACWIRPVLIRVYDSAQSERSVDTAALNILENVIAKAVRWDASIMEFILPEAKKQCSSNALTVGDLKCVLVCLNLARRMGTLDAVPCQADKWKGILSRDVIRTAMVNSSEEIRILALSLLVETSKSTEPLSGLEFDLVLVYLNYNVNTQSPNVRHLTLSLLKKLVIRLESSHRVLSKRTSTQKDGTAPSVAAYKKFLASLRGQCFDNLLPGANYSRRAIALQLLVWCEELHLEGYRSDWCDDYADKLLLHLEDSYEKNKALALEALTHCPREYLEPSKASSLRLSNILREASSVKPPDCVSAAYKLQLLQRIDMLPEQLASDDMKPASEPTTYQLLNAVYSQLKKELKVAQQSVLVSACTGPMYGLLLCARQLLGGVDVDKLSTDALWTSLIASIVATCFSITCSVAPVVNNSSPEGHLPMDAAPGYKHLESDGNGLSMETVVKVTAQMVLLCAWRSVKEVSLLLGEISSRLHIVGEQRADPTSGNLTHEDIRRIGDHFTTMLAETKHRGAFEQAYVGFTKLCARLWQCTHPALHGLPRTWLAELMEAIASGDKSGKLCATRRSAGVPYMIQALVTTELQVSGNLVCFHECMTTLLSLADFTTRGVSLETRTHCLNILRALFRHTALGEVVNGYVGIGLVTAIRGFDGTTWAERNSSTLLFSSLMVRIFGVQRSKDSDKLCIRNKMTGRTFFLRYPSLYDFMLEKLQEESSNNGQRDLLRPSLYPVLLLLARLYPYSLEESTTNLKCAHILDVGDQKLAAFVPHVQACGGSRVLKTRQLVAKAIVPLISHDKYLSHINELLTLLADRTIKLNFCHGLLLQLIRLLEWKMNSLKVEEGALAELMSRLESTLWILEQVQHGRPCYITADEYTKLLNMLIWRFPLPLQLLQELTLKLKQSQQQSRQQDILDIVPSEIPFLPKLLLYGKALFFANLENLHLVLLLKLQPATISEIISERLDHEIYEVVLSVLNFLLLLHGDLETDCKFHEHMLQYFDENVRREILERLEKLDGFKEKLFKIAQSDVYLECTQKALIVLAHLDDTQAGPLGLDVDEPEDVIDGLLNKIQKEHDNVSQIYIVSLRRYVTKILKNCLLFEENRWVEIVKVLYDNSSSDNVDATRRSVVQFFEDNLLDCMSIQFKRLNKSEKFEYYTSIWATIVTLLEDDEEFLRQRTSDLVLNLAQFTRIDTGETHRVVPSRAAEILLRLMVKHHKGLDATAALLVLALLEFNSNVYVGDEITDECRVFDQSEKYNTFLEEFNWTKECLKKIKHTQEYKNCIDMVIKSQEYSAAFQRLCSDNYNVFTILYKSNIYDEFVNPKVRFFMKNL